MTFFRNVGAIVQKEWRHYFGSPIAYVALVIWCFLFGAFFYISLSSFLAYSLQSQASEFGPKLSINEMLIGYVLYDMAIVALFVAPMLTMRLFAEERRQGTMELLATTPLTDFEIVIGKFLGAMALYGLMIAVGLLNLVPIWMWATTRPEWKPLATAVLALLLVGACIISAGLFISTLTKNQIVAGFLTFAFGLVTWVLPGFARSGTGATASVVTYLGLLTHVEDLMKGVVDLKDVVYYLSFVTFGLLLAHQSVESQRWRA